jgi:hypothetical protein
MKFSLPLAIVGFIPFALLGQERKEVPSWKWTEEEWRGAVERVRAGRSPLPRSGPMSVAGREQPRSGGRGQRSSFSRSCSSSAIPSWWWLRAASMP